MTTILNKPVLAVFCFIFIILIPEFLFVYFSLSAKTVGVLALCSFVTFFGLIFTKITINKRICLLIILLYIYILAISLFVVDPWDLLISLFGLTVLLSASLVLGGLVKSATLDVMFNCSKAITIFMILIGFLSIFSASDFVSYTRLPKSIFPFAEPSYFGLVASFFSLPIIVLGTASQRFLVLSMFFIFTFIFESMVFLGYAIMFSILLALIFDLIRVLVITTLFGFLVALGITSGYINIDYFLARLILDSSSSSMTLLIYIDSWSRLFTNFGSIFGTGAGFNQTSLSALEDGAFSYEILGMMDNRVANDKDGSFWMIKLLFDFGLIGIFLLLFYLSKLYKSIKTLFRLCLTRRTPGNKLELIQLLYFWSLVPMFMRGTLYFSPESLLFLSLIFAEYSVRNQMRQNSTL